MHCLIRDFLQIRWRTDHLVVTHHDVIKWKHFPCYGLLFVRGIRRWLVNYPHKGQWRGALLFSLICARINRWVNNREAGDWIWRPSVVIMLNLLLPATPEIVVMTIYVANSKHKVVVRTLGFNGVTRQFVNHLHPYQNKNYHKNVTGFITGR